VEFLFLDTVLDWLSIPFIEAGFTTLFIGTAAFCKKKFDAKPYRALFDRFLGDSSSDIHVVLPLIKQKSLFSEITKTQSPIPDNVLFMPYDESLAAQMLKDRISEIYPKRRVVYHDSHNFVHDQKTFICIGGPAINVVSRDLLLTRMIDSKFKMDFLGRFASDETDGRVFMSNTSGGSITEDYGFIFITENPYQRDSCVCLVFGIWSHGANSAIQALCSKGAHLSELVNELKTNKSLFAVTKSTVRGMVTGFPSMERVRGVVGGSRVSSNPN